MSTNVVTKRIIGEGQQLSSRSIDSHDSADTIANATIDARIKETVHKFRR